MTGAPAAGPEVPRSEGGPIHCFEWSHSHIYNPELKVFEESKEIDLYCVSDEALQRLGR